MSETVLVLVRHGETAANQDGIWHGSIDTPLSTRGQAQAQRVARWLAEQAGGAEALYTSPLQRAAHTAAAIGSALALEASTEHDLTEFDLGEWEGKTYQELHEVHDLWGHMRKDPHYAPHGGESPLGVAERFVGALRRIAAAHAGGRVIAVAHGGALSLAFAHLLDGDYRHWRRVMANCAVSELVFEPEPVLRSFNRTEHLADL